MEKGIESLKAAVKKDCEEGNNCFNENGCDHEFYRMVPQSNPEIVKMGFKEMCIRVSKCSHKYCDKFKWAIDRAKHYAERTGKTTEEIIEIWEKHRDYWYMNYYQDCKIPLLTQNDIINYDNWIATLNAKFGAEENWKFRCPSCGNIQSIKDFQDAKIEDPNLAYFSCIGRYVKDKGCKYTLGGLIQINKQSVFKDGLVYKVFEMA